MGKNKRHHKRRYRSDAFEAIHEAARALHSVADISKTTMREFDESCLEMADSIKAGADTGVTATRESVAAGLCPLHERGCACWV